MGSTPYLIRTPAQLRVLNSPQRWSIVELLMDRGPRTAASIAADVGLSAQAAHYHIGRLVDIGLVKRTGTRRTGARPEAVFRIAASDVILAPARDTGAFRREKARGARLFLRRAEREIAASIESGEPLERVRITRDAASLSDRDLERLNALLMEIHELMGRAHAPDEPNRVALTVALAPLR